MHLIGIIISLVFWQLAESLTCKSRIPLASRELTEDDKQIILDMHNAFRQLVALGQISVQPQASNLLEMKWDDQLAERAQLWSDSCYAEEHDESRHISRFFVGQNIATTWTTRIPSSKIDIWPDFPYAIKEWFKEFKIYKYGKIHGSDDTTGHYTQMLWAKTYLVGCGFSFYYDPAKGYTKNYVCNYGPSGNVISQEPYKIGPPSCRQHKMKPSHKFLGLCDKSQDLVYGIQLNPNQYIDIEF